MNNRYTKYLPSSLQEAYVAAQEDPDMMDLKGEMALLRSLLAEFVNQNAGDIDREMIASVSTLVDRIGKVHSNIVDYEYKNRQVISISMIPVIIRSISHIVRTVIMDETKVAEIANQIGDLPLMLTQPMEKEAKVE